MRILALAIATIAVVSAAVPARAQMFDPNYPVCLQVFSRGGGYNECGYTSMAQCRQTASGRSALCINNPYYAGAPAGRRAQRRGY